MTPKTDGKLEARLSITKDGQAQTEGQCIFVNRYSGRGFSPSTGDHTPWLPWLGVLLLSGLALGADSLLRKRRRIGKHEK